MKTPLSNDWADYDKWLAEVEEKNRQAEDYEACLEAHRFPVRVEIEL